LQETDFPRPTRRKGEVLIKVMAGEDYADAQQEQQQLLW
jgi:hypothetical protein